MATGQGNNAETFRYGTSNGASLVVNGARPQANNFTLDGLDNNESLVNTIVFFPSAEAIQEFKVQTNIAPAEFGRAGGAIVNTTLKSGGNEIHGSGFEFIRNDNVDARPTFAPTISEFRRNQFGGAIGAPIHQEQAVRLWRLPGLPPIHARGGGLRLGSDAAHAARAIFRSCSTPANRVSRSPM